MKPSLKRLKKRHETQEDRREKRQYDIVKGFEFMEPDVIDLVSDEDIGDFIVEDQEDVRGLLQNEGILLNIEDALRAAFLKLRSKDVEGFLKADVIQHMFSSVYALLSSFGSGTTLMKKVWRLSWVEPIHCFKYGFIFKDLCQACGRQRMIRYFMLYDDEKGEHVAQMGTDCYEIKVKPLVDLVKFCQDNVNNDDMEDLQSGLESHLTEIREAPIHMAKLYNTRYCN